MCVIVAGGDKLLEAEGCETVRGTEVDGPQTEEKWYPMTVADIAKLALREKLLLMEAIWEDLRGRVAPSGPT